MHLIVGSALAGDKVVVNPVMIEKAEVTATIDLIGDKIPNLYASCAVTRAMTEKVTLEKALVGKGTNSDYTYGLNGTFLPSMYNESDQQASLVCLSEKQDIDQNANLTQDKGSNASNSK